MPGVCDRNGHRRKKRAGESDRRGRYDRSEMELNPEPEGLDTMDLHADCREVCTELYNSVKTRFAGSRATEGIQSEEEERH